MLQLCIGRRSPSADRLRPAAMGAWLVALALLAPPLLAQNPKNPRHVPAGDLTNPFLGPKHAQWLIGPNSWLLDEQGRQAYLLLGSDEEAAAFVRDFWSEHAGIERLYRERVAEADQKFREATYAGHHTDRGTIWVLYGPPEETSFLDHQDVHEPTIEQWKYAKDAPAGLDGRQPNRVYRFANDGALTTFYQKDPRATTRRQLESDGRLPQPP